MYLDKLCELTEDLGKWMPASMVHRLAGGGFMERIARMVTGHRKLVVGAFLVLSCICAVLMTKVRINYTLADYLPEDAESTVALGLMQDEFNEAIPNGRVMVRDVSIAEALEYKEKLEQIDGVDSVMWLDDVVNVKEPLATQDVKTVEAYYKDRNALFQVTFSKGMEMDATNEVYELIGEDNAVDGDAAANAFSQKISVKESMNAMMILIPVIIVILLLTSSSWAEPILFLATIGISVLINMGSNIFLGEISYITQAISPILQMAVSLDYAIFLLHNFEEQRKLTEDVERAMVRAMKLAFPSVAASAATTLFGFMALMFMRFGIGSDLGLNLVKGIIFSYLSVMVFLPALTLLCYRLIDRTKHKKLVPELHRAGNVLVKIRVPAFILVLLLIVPCYRAQARSNFIYGMGEANAALKLGQDSAKINQVFGCSTSIVLLVPKGDTAKELLLCSELDKMEHVNGIVSYVTSVGDTIPPGYLEEKIVANFYSENYARIVVNTDTSEEGEEAFALVEKVRNLAEKYYEESYSCGQSTNLYDMKQVVSSDTKLVNGIAVLAIAFVLLLTFKSLLLPVILLFIIEAAIWINLSVPYFAGNSLVYIGFLVINTVQLGATIDYAIFITGNYITRRKEMGKKEAMQGVLNKNLIAIMTSALILASAGFCLKFTSSNPIVAELGLLLGRGTFLSLAMVAAILPMLLLLLDRAIGATTYHAAFYKGVEK